MRMGHMHVLSQFGQCLKLFLNAVSNSSPGGAVFRYWVRTVMAHFVLKDLGLELHNGTTVLLGSLLHSLNSCPCLILHRSRDQHEVFAAPPFVKLMITGGVFQQSDESILQRFGMGE